MLAAVMACAATDAVAAAGEPAGLPPLVRTKHRTFTIPFRLPPTQDPDADAAPQRVELQVSRDLGGSWDKAGETAPTTGSFTYASDVDGEYWFRLRAIDRKGRGRGSAGADMRVLVDAAGPRLVARVWKGVDGEIICRFAAADDSIEVGSLKFEYRAAGDQGWKTVAAEGILARQSPAHLVGEEIWWAGEKVDSLTVRIAVSDTAGNQTVRQFTMEPADPRVDQAALAGELGVPALPMQSAPSFASGSQASEYPSSDSLPASRGLPEPPPAPPGFGGPWPAESARWPDASTPPPSSLQPTPGTPPDATGQSVLVREAATIVARPTPLATVAERPPVSALGHPLDHQGRPLHLTRSRRFAWDYEMPPPDGSQPPGRAELWTTLDSGVTWQRTAVDDDGQSPIEVELPAAGLYGVRLEIVAVNADGRPRSGAVPDCWVGVDDESPTVEINVHRMDGPTPMLTIRYAAHDSLPASRGGRLVYSPQPDGPWVTIAAELDPQGEYRWEPDRGVPARVFVRAEVVDAAGNVGSATTPEAIIVSATRTSGRLGGLTPLP
jgi:hypothetical protein